MSNVVQFRPRPRTGPTVSIYGRSDVVVVLPVVRIERPGEHLISRRTRRRVQHELERLRAAVASTSTPV